jgi:glycosyltransferase involved in cell wall biosynthesis
LARNADLAVAHSASTLWVARELMKKGRKVGVDFEDWFSREHQNAPWHPDKVIATLEKEVLLGASHATCTSLAMADAIDQAYGRRPEVIYNAFPMAEAPEPAPQPGPEGPKVIWISQVLGSNRGLEFFVKALSFCEPRFMVTLVGNPQEKYDERLNNQLPVCWQGKVIFKTQVKSLEVLKTISKHHIGLALEQDDTQNHDLTISNKVFQYLLCGLAVAATGTKGQTEVGKMAKGAIKLCDGSAFESMAKNLMSWFSEPKELTKARLSARQVAKSKLSWEHEAEKLKKIVASGLR